VFRREEIHFFSLRNFYKLITFHFYSFQVLSFLGVSVMFSPSRSLLFSVLAAGVLCTSVASAGDYGSPRQYYSSWQKYPQRTSYYRHYYYKPSPTYSGYKHHYVVYAPQKPKYVYYYNPYKKVYWGRCPVEHHGEGVYSLLAEKDRKPTLDEIPEEAFPPPAPVPSLPEATDAAPLDLPPDDLPADAVGAPAPAPPAPSP
jgi:hypothetical protein